MSAPEPFAPFFAALELPTFSQLVAGGDLSSLSDITVESYAKIAACVWSGAPMSLDGDLSMGQEMALHFGYLLAQVVDPNSTNFFVDPEGRAFLRVDDNLVEVTEERFAHWEAMFTLCTDEETARAFLALVPTDVGEMAEAQSDTTWEWAFGDLADRLDI
jgi:hypothetical protein